MKTQIFQMRISEDTRKKLELLKKHLNLSSAAAVIDMLIAKEVQEIEKKNDNG